MSENWDRVVECLFDQKDESANIFVGLMSDLFLEPSQFRRFAAKISSGEFFQFYQSHYVLMPINLVEDDRYTGEIEIVWDCFDDVDRRAKINLSTFCLWAGIAFLFFSRNIDNYFDAEMHSKKLDQISAQYAV